MIFCIRSLAGNRRVHVMVYRQHKIRNNRSYEVNPGDRFVFRVKYPERDRVSYGDPYHGGRSHRETRD